MAYNCDPDIIVSAAACYLEPNIGVEDRRAIEILARVKELAALGGTNYTSISQLLTAAGRWRLFSSNQREAISTFRTVADANTNGAGLSTNLSAQKKLAACYTAMGVEDKKNVLAFLSCAIGVFNKASGDGE